jgi:uncharacterized membrane protein YbhN (UPF0104 family)
MGRALARLALATALGLALLAWLGRGLDWTHLGDALRPVPPWAWSAAVLGLCASYALRALRIRAELGRGRPEVGFRACLEVMLVHNAAVNVVPMRGGEAAYPWLVHRRLGVPVDEAVASLVWMRVQDAMVLAFLAAALWPGLAPAVRVGVVVGLAIAVPLALRLLARFATARDGRATPPSPAAGGEPPPYGFTRDALAPAAQGRPLPHRGQGEGAVALRARLRRALHALALAPRHGWRGWAFCAGSWSVKLLALGGLLAALAGLAPREGLTGALGGELAGVLPLQGPAGLGTYETGVWAGAALRGRTAAEIAAPAIAVHLLSLATALAAGGAGHLLSRAAPARPGSAAPSPRPASPGSPLEHDHG